MVLYILAEPKGKDMDDIELLDLSALGGITITGDGEDGGTVDSADDPNARKRGVAFRRRLISSLARHFTSERALESAAGWTFNKGEAIHVISQGDIDSFTYLRHIAKQQGIEYLLFSTWCMAAEDVLELKYLTDTGRIKRVDAYVGEIFPGSYAAVYEQLCAMIRDNGGRVAVFRNHAKVYAGFGERFDFVIESSANINTNPRSEQTTITIDGDLALFYKDFYDSIKSFNHDFDDWEPYSLERSADNGDKC